MILVAGLGNPGARYARTRHNVGFMVVDGLVGRFQGSWKSQFQGLTSQISVGAERVLALKPQTYMNESGRSVGAAASFYKIPPERIVVVHDELDLAPGMLKLKRGGGAAGHNGIRSVSQQLGSPDFVRVRVGIGKPPPEFRGRGADYVLQGVASAEKAAFDELVERAIDAVVLTVERGLDASMNVINRRVD